MKLINPFKKKQQVNQNKIIEIKYSKLDNIGKVKRFEIPDTTEMNNEINSLKSKITELENNNNLLKEKLDNFNMTYNYCNISFDFTDLVKPTLTPEYFILDWKELSDPKTFEITDSKFTQYLKQNCKYIQKIYLSTVYFDTEHRDFAIYNSPILIHQKTFYVYNDIPEKLTFTYNKNLSNDPTPPFNSLLWQNQLACFTYQKGYPPDFNNKRIYFKVLVELIRVPINNNYLEENN